MEGGLKEIQKPFLQLAPVPIIKISGDMHTHTLLLTAPLATFLTEHTQKYHNVLSRLS